MPQAGRMIKHSSIYAIGNISRQLVGFIMLPIYTHYLSPSDYGVIALIIFVISLIEAVFGARMFQAVPKFFYERNDRNWGNTVVSTAFIITSVASILATLALYTFREPISELAFGTSKYELLVGIFSVMVLTNALENYALGYIRLQQKPWLFIAASFAKLLMQLSLNIYLVVVQEMGVLGIAISSILSATVFTSVMTAYTFWHTGINFSKEIAKRMFIFCWPLWVASLAALYIGSSCRYYIRIFDSLSSVGMLELAAKFGAIISLLVWMPFSQYWETESFRLYQKPNPIPTYQSVFKFITALLVLTALGISIFGKPIIQIMSAPEFRPASSAIPYVVFTVVFQSLTSFCNFSFFVKEKTGWLSRNTYISAGIITVLFLALVPRYGFVGAAQATMITSAIQFLIVHFTAKKHYDMCLSIKSLCLFLAISFVTIAITNTLQERPLVLDISIRVGVYLIGCILIGATLLTDRTTRHFFIDTLRTKNILAQAKE